MVSQNVVTYIAIINIPNQDYSLKPGMTTNVKIEIARKENVLRIPNGAIRFRPTQEIFEALKQETPPELQRGKGGRGGATAMAGGTGGGQARLRRRRKGRSQRGSQTAGSATSGQGADQQNGQRPGTARTGATARTARRTCSRADAGGRGGQGGFGSMDPAERAKRREETMKNMTPEQRKAFEDRMKNGGGRGQGQGAGFGGQNGRQGGRAAAGPRHAGRNRRPPRSGHQLDHRRAVRAADVHETPHRAWLFVDKKLKIGVAADRDHRRQLHGNRGRTRGPAGWHARGHGGEPAARRPRRCRRRRFPARTRSSSAAAAPGGTCGGGRGGGRG